MCLLKTGTCLMQVLFNVFAFSGTEYMLAEYRLVATKAGFTVLTDWQILFTSDGTLQ